MEILVIGAGLSGAVLARKLAENGQKVVVLERKSHVGGHAHDEWINDVLVHKYGPHIFHTDNETAYSFMNQFWTLNDFKNEVLCSIEDKVVPIPFNFTGIDIFFPEDKEVLKTLLLEKYQLNQRVTILELLKLEEPLIKKLVDFIYNNIFKNYTSKMWGKDPSEIDPIVLQRVPVIIGYSTRYFANKYEGVPVNGYSNAIKKMLNHPNISLHLNFDGLDALTLKDEKTFFNQELINCPIIYTGAIDELFQYQFGILEYRSLNIVYETVNLNRYQASGVVNYPGHPTMTRITDYKAFHNSDNQTSTVISYEYPGSFDLNNPLFSTPYYPMMSHQAKLAYDEYKALASKYSNLFLLGRLATFKYINMDEAIILSLNLAKTLLNNRLNQNTSTQREINE